MEDMMKRITAAVLFLVLLLPFFAFTETTNEKPIRFRGLEWYITKREAEATLIAEGADKALLSSSEGDIYRLSAIDYLRTTMGSDRVDDGGFKELYRGLNVAGYKPDVYACYYYHIEDGIIDRNEDKAVFYFGWYEFDYGEFSDYIAVFDDLKAKLSSLYGEPETKEDKYHIIATWVDKDGNTLQLLTNDKYEYISLGYIASGSDERLDAVQVALDAEKAAIEAAEREKNKNNTDGL